MKPKKLWVYWDGDEYLPWVEVYKTETSREGSVVELCVDKFQKLTGIKIPMDGEFTRMPVVLLPLDECDVEGIN